jgi:DNA-binding NtrC family response regulator
MLGLLMARILIIDDEPAMVEVIATICRELGHQVFPFHDAERALEALPTVQPQVVVSDIRMRKASGFDVLQICREASTPPAVVMLAGYASVKLAVETMRRGAYDYVTKPFKIDELASTVQRALDFQGAVAEAPTPRRVQRECGALENIVGASPRMQALYRLIAKVADTDSTILIQGESGTGKELVARALHYQSRRRHHPFVAVNCSALPENLLESELFGHKKGAFTGAVQDKMGLFEEAHHGTIFLDEINSMAAPLQTKLLRVLQERRIRRVGETKSVPVNVRVLAATNEPLLAKTRAGAFREDLYYRLAVIPVEMPPLRERPDDVPLLAEHFVQKVASQHGNPPPAIQPEAMAMLKRYGWPGNVRELENAMERACALCEEGCIAVADLPPQVMQADGEMTPMADAAPGELPIGRTLEVFIKEMERRFIAETIRRNEGSRERTARMLGISMATLYRKLAPDPLER